MVNPMPQARRITMNSCENGQIKRKITRPKIAKKRNALPTNP
jgi:hypothetical protein